MIPADAPRFNGHPVSRALLPALEALMNGLTKDEAALVKASCSQGWAGSSSFSGNTHADGCAVDFLTAKWPSALILKVVTLFRSANCQAVLRLPGESLGQGIDPVTVEHVHAVLNGHGNSAVLAQVTGPAGYRNIARELARRRERRGGKG